MQIPLANFISSIFLKLRSDWGSQVRPHLSVDITSNVTDRKGTAFEIEIFCNILNVFIVPFDTFNASLLNISFNFFGGKNFIDPKLLNGIFLGLSKLTCTN